MHDLNTINRLNAESLGVAAANLRAQGRWVILRKTGLQFSSVESFSTHQEAMNAYLHQVDKSIVGESISLLAPTKLPAASGLDAVALGDDFPEPHMAAPFNPITDKDC